LLRKSIFRRFQKNRPRPFGHVQPVERHGFHDTGFLRGRHRDTQVNIFPVRLFLGGPSHLFFLHVLIVGNKFQKSRWKPLTVDLFCLQYVEMKTLDSLARIQGHYTPAVRARK
jgi:hypothetical protein